MNAYNQGCSGSRSSILMQGPSFSTAPLGLSLVLMGARRAFLVKLSLGKVRQYGYGTEPSLRCGKCPAQAASGIRLAAAEISGQSWQGGCGLG